MKSSISGSRGPAGHFPESGLSQPMPRYSLQASIWASRLESEPAGFNRSHQASIWASRPESEAPGFNLSLEASISAPGFNLSLDASISAHSSQSEHFPHVGPLPVLTEIWHILFMTFAYIGPRPPGPFFPIWVPSKFVLKYSLTDLDFWFNWFKNRFAVLF